MAYDEKKDVTLWSKQVDNLMLTVQKYNSGVAKFQVGPRVVKRADGTESFVKAGRITLEEVEFIGKYMSEIRKAMAA